MARRIVQSRWKSQKLLTMFSILALSGARNSITNLRFGKSLKRMAFLDQWNCNRKSHNERYAHSLYGASFRDNSEVHNNLHENVISSSKSATVKKMQAILSKRKKRIEYGQTIVEGPRMVFDLLQNPKTQSLVRQVLISTVDFTEQYQDRLSQLPSSGSPRIQLVTPEILKSCTDTVTPQGIVALVDIPKFAPRDNTAVSDITVKSPLYLVLDGVADPGNLGTLCRSSYAVGISGVLLLPGCCDIWNPKAVRSSMGASFQLPVVEAASWDEAVDTMTKEWNAKRIYAATMIEGGDSTDDSQNTSHPHYDIDWLARPTALVIGSEGNGLSVDVRKALVRRRPTESDEAYQIEAVHVPMQAGIESLNAAICGSVIMFEYARQCSQANK